MINANKKRFIGYTLFIILFFAAGIYLSDFSFGNKVIETERTQIVMGTVAEIKIKNENKDIANKAINAAFEEIKRIERLFSTYDSSSVVWKINYSKERRFILNDEFFDFIVKCDSIWRLTKGAFDPALGSLTTAWGFNSDSPFVPSREKIEVSLLKSGWNKVRLLNRGILEKGSSLLDFGAVAKGYAADKGIEILKSYGIKKALINLGGQVAAIGGDWIVGIEHPRIHNLLLTKLKVKNNSVSTSGDYEKFFYENGERYCHIFDPHTGYPANSCRSVTVINKNGMFADALSTGCFVLGPVDALKLINSLPCTEGLIIDSSGNQFMSNGFKKFLIK